MRTMYSEGELLTLLKYSAKYLGASEKDTLEFTRCVRPNGSAYGSRGKCRKGTEQAKGEEGIYKPKEVVGGGSVNLDSNQMKYSPFDVESARDDYNTVKKDVLERLKELNNKDLPAEEKEKRKTRLKNKLSAAETTLRQSENNLKFLSDLRKKVPNGVELRTTSRSGIVMLSTTKNGNILTVTYSPVDGFNFMVNGKFSSGKITDRREQIEASLKVKRCWDAIVQALPNGTIVKTAAWDGDGKGAERERAYMKVGFSKGDRNDGNMYSQKKGGAMKPTTDKEAYSAQEKDPHSLYFSEDDTSAEQVKIWLQILTGENPPLDSTPSSGGLKRLN